MLAHRASIPNTAFNHERDFAMSLASATSSPAATGTVLPTRVLSVTALYRLSEEGRKASLLAGGNGKALQELTVDVPIHRLHLVSVDADGVARLKLRPRFEVNALQQTVRIDDDPVYDVPPTLDDLFKDAARNHQLERTYQLERQAAKEQRRAASDDRRQRVAEAFLADASQRAIVHPAPTPNRCLLAVEGGRLLFDATKDVGVARNVPAEAHRRFRADLRVRREHNLQDRAAQLALHEEKKRVVAEWVAAHGSPEQRARQAAGVLPLAEGVEAMTDAAFAALRDRTIYTHDGMDALRTATRAHAEFAHLEITPKDLVVTSTNVEQMNATQWALLNEYRAAVPNATVTLRMHKIAWKRNPRIALPLVFGVLVTEKRPPFTLRREYAVLRDE